MHETQFALHGDDQRVVRVTQDTTQVDGLGGEVWAGAFVLSEFLEANATEAVVARHVIELGAGCGLCGLVTAALGADQVLLTDEYPDLLEDNIAKNHQLWDGRGSGVVASAALEWGDEESIKPFAGKFDTMIGSEITQLGRDLHLPLLETVRVVLRPASSSVALLSMDPCRETCEATCDIRKCTASHFVSVARDAGFTVKKHPSVRLASRPAVVATVGALGRHLPIDEDDWSAVFELRLSAIEL